jgi:hypothetical protein
MGGKPHEPTALSVVVRFALARKFFFAPLVMSVAHPRFKTFNRNARKERPQSPLSEEAVETPKLPPPDYLYDSLFIRSVLN